MLKKFEEKMNKMNKNIKNFNIKKEPNGNYRTRGKNRKLKMQLSK